MMLSSRRSILLVWATCLLLVFISFWEDYRMLLRDLGERSESKRSSTAMVVDTSRTVNDATVLNVQLLVSTSTKLPDETTMDFTPATTTSPAETASLFSLQPVPWVNTTLFNLTSRDWVIDLSHTPVADTKQDPHLGLLDVDGNYFVYDPTTLHRDVANKAISDLLQQYNESETCPPQNATDKEIVAVRRLRLGTPPAHHSPVRILCAVYSYNGTNAERLGTVLNTWAPQCDGFFVGADVTDPTRYMVNVQRKGGENYRNMWNKVRSMLAYMYDHHYSEYDWFHIGGDDMYLLVDNLKGFLSCPDVMAAQEGPTNGTQRPLFMGDTICEGGKPTFPYNTGGPGYTLNKAALKLLVTEALPKWHSRRTNTEDLQTASAFRDTVQLLPTPARARDGSHYYNTFPPGRHYDNGEARFYKRYAAPLNFTWGVRHANEYAAAFHYMPPLTMRQLHAHLYGFCSKESTTEEQPAEWQERN